MKIKFLLFTLLFISIAHAQAPKGVNYQAVARNAHGTIIPAQNISVRFSIIDGTIAGTTIYQENHTATTNNYGLFTLVIGKGTATTGTFAAVNWASGTDKFLKVEIAPTAGGSYELQGTTQLMSVPYSLYSEKTNLIAGAGINITNGNTISATGTPNYTAGNAINITGTTIAAAYQAGTGINIVGPVISGAYQGGNAITITGNTIAANYIAGTGININGATISHGLQAGTGINITGPTISGAYQGGNAINITGNTISANYTAGTGINITGSTISHNFVAGAGINITGNVISAPGGINYWIPDANGIHSTTNRIGVGKDAHYNVPISVLQANSGVGEAVFEGLSDDTWHTAITLKNNPTTVRYSMLIPGPSNSSLTPGSFGVLNHENLRWIFVSNRTTNNFGLGIPTVNAPAPKSTLHIFTGDVNIEQIGSGIILRSPNGQCWRVTIDNSGNLVRTSITCP